MKKQTTMEILCQHIKQDSDKLYRLAYSYVKNEQDAMDIVQDSTYKMLKNIDKIKKPQYIGTLYYRIVINTAIDFLRKHKKETVGLPIIESGKEDDHERFYLWDVLDVLEDTSRTIVILRYFEERPLAEIAEILQLNLNTVKSKLYRALRVLHDELNAEEESQYVKTS